MFANPADPQGHYRLPFDRLRAGIAIYDYSLDVVGNRKRVTETLVTPAGGSLGAFFVAGGEENPTFNVERSTLYLPLLVKGNLSGSTANPQPPTLDPSLSTLYLPAILKEDPSLFAALLAGPAITRTIVYTYDKLYHVTNANYTTGEIYSYTYDPVGNRKSQTALAQTTVYTYDTANRLTNAGAQAYTWSANGNLLSTGVSTNTFDVANRLTQSQRATNTLQIAYNGLNDRVSQTVGATTTNFALDVAGGLPEVISTTRGTAYLHLPGVIMAQGLNLPD